MARFEDTEKIQRRRAREEAVNEELKKLEKFQVDRRRIVFIDGGPVASGGYGIIQQAELHQSAYLPVWMASRRYGTPQLVAVKQIKIAGAELKRAFTKEMLVWSGLKAHPGIAKFIGFCTDLKRSEAWLLSPWESNGNVGEFIHTHNPEIPEKLSLIYDTIDALTFLHKLNPPVCHGDIKSRNVLVNAKLRAILCDFGLARLHEDSGFARLETSTGFKASIRWCSPEVLNGEPRTPPSDVYSWAWLVWEIMTGKLPYEGTNADFVIMRQIFESPLPQIDGESRLSDCIQLWDLMTRCWQVNLLQRPTASMCMTVVTYLPRCTLIPDDADHSAPRAELLENLGDLEAWKGNMAESFRYLNDAHQLYVGEGNAAGIASVLRKQAAASYQASDYHQLRVIAAIVLEHCRKLGDSLGVADASFWLGCSLKVQGKTEDAMTILRESLDIYRTQGNDVGVVKCLERIGEIQRLDRRNVEALKTGEEAAAIALRSGDRLGAAKTFLMIGITLLQLNDFAKATDAISEATSIARKVGWKAGLISTAFYMGLVKMREGVDCRAEELFQESIWMARDFAHKRWLAFGLRQLGIHFQKRGRLSEAARALEEAFASGPDIFRYGELMDIASRLAELKSNQGEWDSVLVWYDRIIALCRSQSKQPEVADNLEKKGEILVKVKRYDDAALHFEAAIVVRTEDRDSCYRMQRRLAAIPRTVMQWERGLLLDVKRLQQRLPQLVTANLKLPIPPIPSNP